MNHSFFLQISLDLLGYTKFLSQLAFQPHLFNNSKIGGEFLLEAKNHITLTHIFLILINSKAHLQVRMVTGDNIQTAKAIAAECGILTPNGVAIEGKDFRVMTADEQYELLPNVDVRLYFLFSSL